MADDLERLLYHEHLDKRILFQRSREKGGFLSNNLRRKIWPKILNIDKYVPKVILTTGVGHRDKQQCVCDVERSFQNVLVSRNTCLTQNVIDNRRAVLDRIIMSILTQYPALYYYQGLNDVFSVVILVVEDENTAYLICRAIVLNYLFDFMQPDFKQVTILINLIFKVIEEADKEVYKFLKGAGVEPYFATSWVLTWLTHDVKDLNKAARTIDSMLCSTPMFSIYLSSAVTIVTYIQYMIQHRRKAKLLLLFYSIIDRDSFPQWYSQVCCRPRDCSFLPRYRTSQ